MENTRAAYRRDAQIFLTYLEVTGLDLLTVRRAHVDVFARTRQTAVSALYAYALNEGALQLNPVVRVRRVTVDADHSTTATQGAVIPCYSCRSSIATSPGCHDLLTLYGCSGVDHIAPGKTQPKLNGILSVRWCRIMESAEPPPSFGPDVL